MRKIEEFQKTQKLIDEFENLKKSIPAIDEKIKLSENQAKLRVERLEEQKQMTFQDVEFDINPDDLRNEIDNRIKQEQKNLANEYKKSDEEKRKIEDKIKYFRTDSNIKTITMEIKDMEKEVEKCKLEVRKIDLALEEYYMEGEHTDEDKFKWKQLYDQRDTFNDNIKTLNSKIAEYSNFKQTLLSIELTPDEYKKLNEIEEKLAKAEQENGTEESKDGDSRDDSAESKDDDNDPTFKKMMKDAKEKADKEKADRAAGTTTGDKDDKDDKADKRGKINSEFVEKYSGYEGNGKNGLKYSLIGNDDKEVSTSATYGLKNWSKELKELQENGIEIDGKRVELTEAALKKVDPFLLRYLSSRDDTLRNKIVEALNSGKEGALSEYKDKIKYNMTGASKLGFINKLRCRKITLRALENGLTVENAKETMMWWDKLLGRNQMKFEAKEAPKALTDGKEKEDTLKDRVKVDPKDLKDPVKTAESVDKATEKDKDSGEPEK